MYIRYKLRDTRYAIRTGHRRATSPPLTPLAVLKPRTEPQTTVRTHMSGGLGAVFVVDSAGAGT